MTEYIKVEDVEKGIARITIQREEKRGALSLALMEELISAFETLAKREDQFRVAILTGTGKAFCSGLDLQEAAQESLIDKMAQHVAHLFKTIYTSPLVTIAAVQGDAIAGGAGLVAACDFALLARDAKIGFPEVRRGLIASQVAHLLLRQIRTRDVRELLLLGELQDSQKALQMGLVNLAVEGSTLMDEAVEMARKVRLGGPFAIKQTKHLLQTPISANYIEGMQLAMSLFQMVRRSDEAQDGLEAFVNKLSPSWVVNGC